MTYEPWISEPCEEGDHVNCMSGPHQSVELFENWPCECGCHTWPEVSS